MESFPSKQIIHTTSYPRAALIGNPSDGYFGKTIAFPFSNFQVEVWLEEHDRIEILPSEADRNIFQSLGALYDEIVMNGYYGGERLIKAAIKQFMEYCRTQGTVPVKSGFRISYKTDIPRQLGMGGSSAIITAVMKALMAFYRVDIPVHTLANIVLAAETVELGINAGLQDRVVQAYESPVYMDFNKQLMEERGYGEYKTLSSELFSNLYIAYQPKLSEVSEVLHDDLRRRYDSGEIKVVQAMKEFSWITTDYLEILDDGSDFESMTALINRNFDLRKSICRISPSNLEMINIARSIGAGSKFTGSGGAIIGSYADENMYNKLRERFQKVGVQIFQPDIVNHYEG